MSETQRRVTAGSPVRNGWRGWRPCGWPWTGRARRGSVDWTAIPRPARRRPEHTASAMPARRRSVPRRTRAWRVGTMTSAGRQGSRCGVAGPPGRRWGWPVHCWRASLGSCPWRDGTSGRRQLHTCVGGHISSHTAAGWRFGGGRRWVSTGRVTRLLGTAQAGDCQVGLAHRLAGSAHPTKGGCLASPAAVCGRVARPASRRSGPE